MQLAAFVCIVLAALGETSIIDVSFAYRAPEFELNNRQ